MIYTLHPALNKGSHFLFLRPWILQLIILENIIFLFMQYLAVLLSCWCYKVFNAKSHGNQPRIFTLLQTSRKLMKTCIVQKAMTVRVSTLNRSQCCLIQNIRSVVVEYQLVVPIVPELLDSPRATISTLMNISGNITWIHKNRKHSHKNSKYNETPQYFIGCI